MDKWLSHPTVLKILSVVIAILLFAVVHFDPELSPNQVASTIDTREFTAVKISARGLDPDTQYLRSIEPSTVQLLVEGRLADLVATVPDVWVDVSGLGEGVHDLVVRYDIPGRVTLRSITPSRVKVDIVPVQTKEFEAVIRTEGTPANGYKVADPIVKPNNRVFVQMPKDQLDRVAYVGAVINVDGVESNVVEQKVRLAAYDMNGNEIEGAVLNPSVVEVEVPITKPFKKLPLEIQFTGRLPIGMSIASFKPSTDTVTVYGPQDVLDRMEFYDGVYLNLSTVQRSGTVTLNLAPTGGLAQIEPKQIEIEIEIEPSETITLPQIPVTMSGLTEGMKARFIVPESGAVDLNVTGAPSVLADLTAKDVQVIADLNGLPPGTHMVVLDVHLPQFVAQSFPQRLTATVQITDGTEDTASE
jgi:YbbR domain-containing protein